MKENVCMVMIGITIVVFLAVNNNYQEKSEINDNIYPVRIAQFNNEYQIIRLSSQNKLQPIVHEEIEPMIIEREETEEEKIDELKQVEVAEKEVEVPEKEVTEKEVIKPEGDYITFEAEVTAYTAGVQCTGKTPDHPQYGITASGEMVQEGNTIAAPDVFPFYTKIEIPGYGTGKVKDRGGAIKYNTRTGRFIFDVYFESLAVAERWGRKVLEVKVYTNSLDVKTLQAIQSRL